MQTLVTIIDSEGRSGTSKNGKPYKIVTCQCVVHLPEEDGVIRQKVGVLTVPEKLCPIPAKSAALEDLPEVPNGDYLAEYGLTISYDKKELGGTLKALTRRDPKPVNPSLNNPKPEAKAAA